MSTKPPSETPVIEQPAAESVIDQTLDQTIKPKRRYRRITPEVIARFRAEMAVQGNGTRAVALLEPDSKRPDVRAVEIQAKASEVSDIDYVGNRLQQIAVTAVERVNDMVNSTDEQVATRNAHFVIDHAVGKAVQRNENTNLNVNIENLLQ